MLDWCLAGGSAHTEQALLTNLRQKNASARALAAVERGLVLCAQPACEELLAVEVDMALNALGDVMGHTTTEDVLGLVFARFCVGK